MTTPDKNVLGGPLAVCSSAPRTGFFRDGCCNTGADDVGIHVICARMTREFLEFERQRGNDLVTPMPAAQFPGLSPGDRWCVCAGRWREAFTGEYFCAPEVTFFPYSHVGSPQEVIMDRFLSVSFIAALPEAPKAMVTAQLQALIDTHPALKGRETVAFPYETQAYVCHRLS